MTRTDAAHNRERILASARAAFASDGLDLAMREIARRAGLGVATVYRHFPTRADLLHAVLADRVAACSVEMHGALADPDAWSALCGTIRVFAHRQVVERGLNEALLGSHAAGAKFAAERREHVAATGLLVDRARVQGALRDGVTVHDVRVGLRAIASFRSLPPERARASVDRLAELLIAGLAARA